MNFWEETKIKACTSKRMNQVCLSERMDETHSDHWGTSVKQEYFHIGVTHFYFDITFSVTLTKYYRLQRGHPQTFACKMENRLCPLEELNQCKVLSIRSTAVQLTFPMAAKQCFKEVTLRKGEKIHFGNGSPCPKGKWAGGHHWAHTAELCTLRALPSTGTTRAEGAPCSILPWWWMQVHTGAERWEPTAPELHSSNIQAQLHSAFPALLPTRLLWVQIQRHGWFPRNWNKWLLLSSPARAAKPMES